MQVATYISLHSHDVRKAIQVLSQMLRKRQYNVLLCQWSARTSARLHRCMQRTIARETRANLPYMHALSFRDDSRRWTNKIGVRANITDLSVNPSYPIGSGHPSPAYGTTLLLPILLLSGTLALTVCCDPPDTPISSNWTIMEKMKETRKQRITTRH